MIPWSDHVIWGLEIPHIWCSGYLSWVPTQDTVSSGISTISGIPCIPLCGAYMPHVYTVYVVVYHSLDMAYSVYLSRIPYSMVWRSNLRSRDTSYLMYYTYSGYLPTVCTSSTGCMVLWYTMVYPLWGLCAPCTTTACSGVPLTRDGILCIPIPDTIFYGLMSRSEVLRYLISGDLIPILSTYTGYSI